MPPVPLERFLAFAGERSWPCDDAGHAWTLQVVCQAAVSILYMLGEPAIFAGDPEKEAFARWYSLYGSEVGRALSLRAIKIADGVLGQPADHYSMSFDDPVRGWDRSAWKPTSDHIRRLNTWIENVLVAINATLEPDASRPPAGGRSEDQSPTATDAPKPQRRNPGGRPPKYDWDLLWIRIIWQLANTPDGLPERRTGELGRHVTRLCNEIWGDEEPSSAMVRGKVAKLYQKRQKPQRHHTGGGSPKFEWDLFWVEIVGLANTPDGLLEREALYPHMLDFCAKWGAEAPDDITVEEKIAKLYRER